MQICLVTSIIIIHGASPVLRVNHPFQLMEALQNIFRQTHMNALHIRSQQYADPPQHQQAMTAVEELLSRLKRCVQSIVVAFLGRRGLRQALFTECDPATGAEKNSTDMEPAKTQSPRLQLL